MLCCFLSLKNDIPIPKSYPWNDPISADYRASHKKRFLFVASTAFIHSTFVKATAGFILFIYYLAGPMIESCTTHLYNMMKI